MKAAIAILTFVLITACKTTAPESTVKADVAVSTTSSLQPPVGLHLKGDMAEYLRVACEGGSVVSPGSLFVDDMGCVATDGANTFRSMSGGNNGLDGTHVWGQICRAHLDPTTFESACFEKDAATWASSPLAPPAGMKVKGNLANYLNVFCEGGSVASPGSLFERDTGCVATDWVHTFRSMNGGNNGLDGTVVWGQICREGLNPATFNSVCFERE